MRRNAILYLDLGRVGRVDRPRAASLWLVPLVATLLLASSWAQAVPADIIFVLDTSASMNEPVSDAEGAPSKLDRGKEVISKLADAAAVRGHRVSLFRFRQAQTIVATGEGEKVLVTEHEHQCVEMVDVVVPHGSQQQGQVKQWVDGQQDVTNPELVAIGDSPLYGSIRVALRYIRALRQLRPGIHCVNAAIFVVTDGNDTCAAGGELVTALAELGAQGADEDIRAYIVSFDPSTDAARLIADVGHEAPELTEPFSFEQADAAVLQLQNMVGRIAPAGCVISGVAEELLTSNNPDADVAGGGQTPAAEDPDTGSGDSDGCAAGSSSAPYWAPYWAWAWLLWLLPTTRRQKVAALALASVLLGLAGGCSSSDDGDPTAGEDSGTAAPQWTIVTPEDQLTGALAELDEQIAAAQSAIDDKLAPDVLPEAAFALITGDTVQGCRDMLDQVAYEPYRGAQRGAVGCWGTRRCSGLDQALLLQACLEFHGWTATVHSCEMGPNQEALLASLATEPTQPSIAEAVAVVQAPFAASVEKLEASEFTDLIESASVDLYQRDIDVTVDADIAGIRALVDLDPVAVTAQAQAYLTKSIEYHYLVAVDDKRIVPVLGSEDGLFCFDDPFDWTTHGAQARVELLVQYAELYEQAGGLLHKPVVALEHEWNPAAQWGEPIVVSIGEEGHPRVDVGLPPVAEKSCFQAHLSGGAGSVNLDGEPAELQSPTFFVAGQQASDCSGPFVVEPEPNLVLVRVILRTGARDATANGTSWRYYDRVLIDRWGYAIDTTAALASGPQYTIDAMRSMVPLRAELHAGGGRPTFARHYYELLRHVVGSRDWYAYELARTFGVMEEGEPPARPTSPVHSSTMAWYTDRTPRLLGASLADGGLAVMAGRPWRTMTLRRRGYGVTTADPMSPGLGFQEQTIFDIIDVTDVVYGPAGSAPAEEHEARLLANIGLGALLTEAERIAVGHHEETMLVVNAGDMFRHGGVEWGKWNDGDVFHSFNYPMAVRDAATARIGTNHQLIVSPPDTPALDGNTYTAWWRVDETNGFALGEMRYDGTFYGGGAASAIGNFAHCLAFQAVQALTCSAQVIPNIDCCRLQVLAALMFGLVPYGGEVLMGLQGAGVLPAYGDPPGVTQNIRDGLLMEAQLIVDAQTAGGGVDPGENPLAAALTILQTAAEAYDAAVTVKKPPPCMQYVVDNESVIGGGCPDKKKDKEAEEE